MWKMSVWGIFSGHFFRLFTRNTKIHSVNIFLQTFYRKHLSGPYFPVFAMNTEICFINFRTQSEYGKIQAWRNSVPKHFQISLSYALVNWRITWRSRVTFITMVLKQVNIYSSSHLSIRFCLHLYILILSMIYIQYTTYGPYYSRLLCYTYPSVDSKLLCFMERQR